MTIRTLRSRGMVVALVGCVAITAAVPVASAHKRHHQTKVAGTWSNPLGSCVNHIISFDAATGALKCTGTSEWTGTWRGSTTWTVTGTQNISTGAASGRIDEVFTGRAAHGRGGTLTFVEHFTLDSAGHIDIRGHIVKGSGGLVGSTGHARWTGTSSVTDGSGSGPYSGRWSEGHGHHRH